MFPRNFLASLSAEGGIERCFPFLVVFSFAARFAKVESEKKIREEGGEVFYGLFKASAAAEPRHVRKGMRVLDRERWTSSLLCLLEEQEKIIDFSIIP